MSSFYFDYDIKNALNSKQDVCNDFKLFIEKQFDIRRSTVTNILQGMEKQELIIRKSVNNDARLKMILLTDKAKNILSLNTPAQDVPIAYLKSFKTSLISHEHVIPSGIVALGKNTHFFSLFIKSHSSLLNDHIKFLS